MNAGKVWTAMKSFAVFMLIIQCYGNMALANMMNPANNSIASISKPTGIQNGLGSILANGSLVVGIWIFRKYFMASSWRLTLFMSQFFLALANALLLMCVYDTWGISRNGWFFMVSSNLPSLIQGIGRVVSNLPIIEIAPKGLEATVYELIVSANNGAISMNVALQTVFGEPFQLAGVNSVSWDKATPTTQATYMNRMMMATVFSLLVNIGAAFLFMFFLPRNAEHCRTWAGKQTWKKNRVAVLNCVVFLVPFIYANYTTVSRLLS